MKKLLRLALPCAAIPTLALAVYAPIPEQEQGKPLTYRLGTSIYHDSNIFGAASGEIDSLVYNLTGGLSFNGSLDAQTFASASYQISNDYMPDRPGDHNLTSHSLAARYAHAFSDATNVDLSGTYDISKNPQSLSPLNNQPLNTDQSFKRAQFDGRFTTTAGPKTGVVAKYRLLNYSYDNAAVATDLDRYEHLAGLELSYAYLPETKLVGEYRFQKIAYDANGSAKDKTSNFLMGGVDYNPGKQTLISARLGFEDRNRESGGDTTAPYVELSGRFSYYEGSYVATGYTYTMEESSDVVNFTDTKVNRFFVNVQHRLTGTLTASGSLTYEPSQLQGRGAQADVDEKTTRFGLGVSWQPNRNWTVAGTYDLDNINSDLDNRDQNRTRFGVSARVTF
jgi:hypothetical protein